MLTDQEINDYYDSLVPVMPRPEDRVVDMSFKNTNTNILISAGRLLAVANYSASVKALAEFNKSNIFTFQLVGMEERPNLYFQKNKCWRIRVTEDGKAWQDSPNIESLEQLYDFILISQKAAVLDVIHRRLDMNRRREIKAAQGQNHIYFAKYLEAKEILEKGITEDPICKYPFVTGYADLVGMDIVEASKLIKFKYETRASFLAENETLRLKYTSFVKQQTTLEDLGIILEQFKAESTKYGDSL